MLLGVFRGLKVSIKMAKVAKSESTRAIAKKVDRNSAGLRDALFDELDGLRDGSVNATQANATAKIAAAIVDTVTMEMNAYKILSKNPVPVTNEARIPPIQLGSSRG